MKRKNAKIIIKSVSEIKKEWKEALKGKKRGSQKDNELIFTGLETAAKVFTKNRIEVLKVIISEQPKSIYEISKIVKRDFKNVHSDVKFLAEIGLIELKESGDPRGGLIPVAIFSGIELDLAA